MYAHHSRRSIMHSPRAASLRRVGKRHRHDGRGVKCEDVVVHVIVSSMVIMGVKMGVFLGREYGVMFGA